MSDEQPKDCSDTPDYDSKARADLISVDVGEMMDMQTKWLDRRLSSIENLVKNTLAKFLGKETEK